MGLYFHKLTLKYVGVLINSDRSFNLNVDYILGCFSELKRF